MKLSAAYPRRTAYPQPAQPVVTSQRKPRISSLWIFVYGLAALAAIALPFGLVMVASLYFQASGRILPNVQVGAASVGGMTQTQAAIEIQRVWNLEKPLTLSDGVRSWPVAPMDVGLEVDALKTAQNAAAFGHGGGFGDGLNGFVTCLRSRCQVSPVVQYHPEQAKLALDTLAVQVAIQPVNAAIHLDGAQVNITPGVQGYQLDVQATLAQWSADPYLLVANGRLPLVMQPVQPVIADLSALKAEIETLLSSPAGLRGYDPVTDEWMEWKPAPQQVATWLQVDEQGGQAHLTVDPAQAATWLAQIDATLRPERWIDVEAETAAAAQALQENRAHTLVIKHLPTSYTVESSDTLIKIGWKVGIPYWKILAANPGIDQNALRGGQVLTIPSKDELLPLPVVANKRIVISISQQRMWTYQDGQQLNEYVISTGIDRSPTQPGIFQVRMHELDAYAELWDLHMPHFLGIYEAWPGFFNGIHGLPTLANGQRLWENVLGRPASYGCIILNLSAAEEVYNWAEDGVVVEIQG